MLLSIYANSLQYNFYNITSLNFELHHLILNINSYIYIDAKLFRVRINFKGTAVVKKNNSIQSLDQTVAILLIQLWNFG